MPLPSFVEAATGNRRVHTLFNTHWHLDQIGSNEALGNAGANIVAHEKTRLRLAVGYFLPTEDRYHSPVAVKAQPTESFYTTGSTTIGGRRIEYGYFVEAHTDGDAYVYFRDETSSPSATRSRRSATSSSTGGAAVGSAAASIR